MTVRVAGIELGGTKSVAVLAHDDTIIDRLMVPTTLPGPTLAALVDQVAVWNAASPLAAIGIGSFGPIALDPADPAFGMITASPKPFWSHTDIRGVFAGAFAVPIGFDTDVAGAALAEGRWGAAQGCADHIYLTIGTGVGAGIVAGGRIVHGAGHPEVGHIRVRRKAGDIFAGACPFHGDCLEGLIAGPALAARCGMAGEAIPDDHPVWTHAAAELAEAMAMLILTLAPQRIVLGGGIAVKRPGLLAQVIAQTSVLLADYLAGYGPNALARCLVPAGLGADAGPLGAIALAHCALATG
jgi:fructokinase